MPKIVDPAAQRRTIRDAARRVFARRGVAGVGLTHVARKAGMGRSSIYHYYPDKSALMRDLIRELLAEEEALFAAAVHGEGTPLARMERLTVALTEVFADWSAVGRMILDLRLRDSPLFRPFFKRIRRDLAELIAQGQRGSEFDRILDPRLVSATLIGAIDGLLLQQLVDPRAFPDGTALRETLLAVFRKALST
ncbi:MAG: TetR/AcrR family transcriptional regulator [Myxococcota bacterium]